MGLRAYIGGPQSQISCSPVSYILEGSDAFYRGSSNLFTAHHQYVRLTTEASLFI